MESPRNRSGSPATDDSSYSSVPQSPMKAQQKAGPAAPLREKCRAAMAESGIDPFYLSDENWQRCWGKHFQHLGVSPAQGGAPLGAVPRKYGKGRTLRVMQWNVLAEGLCPDGFLMPLVSKEHVEKFEAWLASLIERGDDCAIAEAAALYSKGHRNVVWQADAGGYVQFVTMAAETMKRMQACTSKAEKDAVGRRLKEMFSPDGDGAKDDKSADGGQFTTNERAVTAVGHRLLRTLWFVEVLQPDVLCVQELDNFEYISQKLHDMGYSCSADGVPPYQRMADRPERAESYAAGLKASQYSFAPKTDLKEGREGKSNARRFLDKIGKPPLEGVQYQSDDDGTAIFWKRDRLRIVGAPEFHVLPGAKDVDDYIAGAAAKLTNARGDSAAVRVRLEFEPSGWHDDEIHMEGLVPAHAFYVVSTHLSSGPEKELRRIAELRSVWPQASGYPEIWCLDANTELDFADPRCLRGNACAVPQHANALRTFLREREPLRSVWEASANYGGPSASGAGSPAAAGGAPVSAQRPVSVWKMRGASSDQVSKMGEDAYSLIDHVFYWGGRLFNRGALALDLREHSAAGESNANRDWLALLPNEVVPSDHLPIVWDFELSVAPRLSLPALINNAAALLRPLVVEHERTLSSSALLDTTVIADSLDSAQRLLARYEGELKAQAEPREFVSSPNSQRDSAMRNRPFDDPRWPTRLDAEAWHILGNEDAFSNLPNRGTLPDGKRRTLREAMFHQSGCLQQLWALLSSKSSKSSYKECARHVAISTACLLLGGCFFARDDLSPKSNNLLALASLRCIFRAIDGGSKKFEAPVDMASMTPFDKALLERRPTDTWLYALAGQVTECLLERSLRFGESHTSGALFWRTGRSHIIDIYELLCHGGGDAGATRVGGALDALINEAEYLLSTHDDQNEIAALCALSSVRWHASGSGRCAARVVAMVVGMIQERPHTFGLRSMHEQVAMRALKQVALSPNIDTGGGLDVLVMALNDHMHTLASDPEHAAKQARALARPAPHAALAFIRSAASVLCGKVPVDRLLVVSQKLQAHGDGASARSRPRGAAVGGAGSVVCDVGSAVEQLARSLRYLGIGVDGTTEAKTVGYILKVLCEVAKHAEGQRTLLTIFLEDRLGTFLSVLTFLGALGVDDPERWRAHLRALQLLNALLRAPETGSSRVVEAFHRRFLADARGRTELHDLATRSLDDSSWSLTDGPPDVARLLRDVAAATQTLLTVCRQRPLAAAGAAAVESREAESFFPDDDAFPADELRGASLLNSSSHFGTDTHPPDSP